MFKSLTKRRSLRPQGKRAARVRVVFSIFRELVVFWYPCLIERVPDTGINSDSAIPGYSFVWIIFRELLEPWGYVDTLPQLPSTCSNRLHRVPIIACDRVGFCLF